MRSAALDPYRSRIRLAQLYGGGRRVAVIDVFRTGERILELLSGVAVVIHNAAFELMQFEARGVELGLVHCTMRAARLTLGEPLEIGKPLEGRETCSAPSYR
jgi:hypothetical protein